jgi:Heterokaryon incompatibility protein (HET)
MRRLWIDAICINQDNPKERGHQVQNTYLIYGRASSVVGWLGKASPGLDVAFDAISWVKQMNTDGHHKRSGSQLIDQFRQFKFAEMQWPKTTEIADPLCAPLSHQWFTRVWVVQKSALAKQLFMQCGYRIASWNDC